MSGAICCLICLLIYAVFIVIGFFLNKKLNNSVAEDIKSKVTAGEIVQILFKKYNLEPVDKQNEDENENEDELPETIEEDSLLSKIRKENHFKFDTTDEIEKNLDEPTYKKEKYECIERVNDKLGMYDINYEENKIILSDDLCDSATTVSSGIAAYQAIKLIAAYQEPSLRNTFISFITGIPRLIIQIGWLLCAIPLFGVIPLSNTATLILAVSIMVSFLLNLLRIIEPRENAEIAINELIEEKIINENEVEPVYDATNALAYKEVTSCFKFLRWFLKYMGYNV